MRAALGLVVVVGCATPYQRMGWSGGYDDARIGRNTYSIEVQVNGYTSAGTAMTYAYRRATEICGDGRFNVLDAAHGSSTSLVATRHVVTTVDKPHVELVVRCTKHRVDDEDGNEADDKERRDLEELRAVKKRERERKQREIERAREDAEPEESIKVDDSIDATDTAAPPAQVTPPAESK